MALRFFFFFVSLFFISITGRAKNLLIRGVLHYINQLNLLVCAENQSIQRHLEAHNVFEVEWFDQNPSVAER